MSEAASAPARSGGGRPGRTRSAIAAVALLLAAVVVTGCAVTSLIDTQQALRADGYQSVSVHFSFPSSGDRVDAHVSVAAPPTQTNVRSVALVVWRHLRERFAVLNVSVRGTGTGSGQVATGTYRFAELQSIFGARNPSWDRTSIRQSAEHLGLAVVGGIVGLVAVVVVVALVVTRRNRRRRPPWGSGPAWVGAGAPLWPPPPGPPSAPWSRGERPSDSDGGWGPPRPPE